MTTLLILITVIGILMLIPLTRDIIIGILAFVYGFALNHKFLFFVIISLLVILPLIFIAGFFGLLIKWSNLTTVGGLFCLFLIPPCLSLFIKSIRPANKYFLTILVVLFGLFLLKKNFPVPTEALGRYSQESQNSFSNWVDISNIHNQPLGVASGIMDEDAVFRDKKGRPTKKMARKGKEFKTTALDKIKVGSEYLVNVMMRDSNGDFISGDSGWVPEGKLQFKNKEIEPPPSFNPPSLAEEKGDGFQDFFSLTIPSDSPAYSELPAATWKTSEPVVIKTNDSGFQKIDEYTFATNGVKTKVWVELKTPQKQEKLVAFKVKPAK
ncbi:MAG: hypothetical protein WAV31_00475 [Candidatus Moraniibacteriota bacterium]